MAANVVRTIAERPAVIVAKVLKSMIILVRFGWYVFIITQVGIKVKLKSHVPHHGYRTTLLLDIQCKFLKGVDDFLGPTTYQTHSDHGKPESAFSIRV
jgi:hypothetical protein